MPFPLSNIMPTCNLYNQWFCYVSWAKMNRALTVWSVCVSGWAIPENSLLTAETCYLVIYCSASGKILVGVQGCVGFDWWWEMACVVWQKDQACVDQRAKAARRLLWITLDKQVCAKIVLVQTDHSKYYQRCLGPCLGSAGFEGKQWPHTHNLSLLEDVCSIIFL